MKLQPNIMAFKNLLIPKSSSEKRQAKKLEKPRSGTILKNTSFSYQETDIAYAKIYIF